MPLATEEMALGLTLYKKQLVVASLPGAVDHALWDGRGVASTTSCLVKPCLFPAEQEQYSIQC